MTLIEFLTRPTEFGLVLHNHESATADKFPRMDTNEAAEGEPRMARMTRMFGITKQARFGNRELA
jgi:hypothetical protein